jgi:ribosomal protein S18 acetylase RimI-like enzyme
VKRARTAAASSDRRGGADNGRGGQGLERPGIASRAIRTLRSEGLGAVMAKAVGALGSGGTVVVFEMRPRRVLERTAPVHGVSVRPLEEADLPDYASSQPSSAEMVAARLRRGDRCVVAVERGRVLGSRWASTVSADIGDLWLSFPLCPRVAYSYDAFTLPEARGRGIAAAVTAALLEDLIEDGAERVINAVLPDNPAGQGLARERSEAVGTLRSNRFGDWQLARCRIPAGYLGPPQPFKGAVPSS